MKKSLFAVLAVVAIASCAKNEVVKVEDNNQITFQTVVGPNTKAMINGATYGTEAPSFGTVAFYNKSGETFPTGAQTYIPLSKVKWDDTNKRWTTDAAYYWPKGGGTLSFFSYSPYTYQETGGTAIPVTVPDLTEGLVFADYDVDAHQLTDLMVAEVVTGKTANDKEYAYGAGSYNGVPTVFRHKLAQVAGFVLKTDRDYDATGDTAGDIKFTMNKIEFLGIAHKGTYTGKITEADTDGWVEAATSVKNYEWDEADHVFSTTAGITIATNETTKPTIANNYLLVLPQTFEDGKEKIRVTYTVSTYNGTAWVDDVVVRTVDLYDIHSDNHKWEMNKKITYTLTFGLEQIYWSPSVVDWDTTGYGYGPTIY